MKTLLLVIPGQPPIPLTGEGNAWTLGRSTHNDVPIPEPSLSRHHARIQVKDGVFYVEDLGSMNGTLLNGEEVKGPRPLQEQDELTLGQVVLTLGAFAPGPKVRIAAEGDAPTRGTLVVPLESLDGPASPKASLEARRLREVIRELQALSLELLKDSPPEVWFDQLLDSLWKLLDPWRAAVLILDPKGGLTTAASRGPEQSMTLRLSQSLVDAALQRKESLLYSERHTGAELVSASMVSSGVTSAIVTPMAHQGEVKGLLYLDSRPPHRPFDEEGLHLASTLAHLATAKLEQARVREDAHARKKVDHELDLARRIQQRLLPGFPPEIQGYEVLGNNLPSRQVSGDLFGWWPREDGRWLFCLADVSGKGLGPGLLMASLQATLEAWTHRDLSVSDLAAQLSRSLFRHTDGRSFITAFLALLDVETGDLSYTNAGHNPALHIDPEGAVQTLPALGLPLGMFQENAYGQTTRRMEPGDLVVMYTDGIPETSDPAGGEFGEEALTRFLVERRAEPLMALDAKLIGELDRHAQGAPYLDDRTLLFLRRS